MNLKAEEIRLTKDGGELQVVVDGVSRPVGRISRAFPESNPSRYIGLQDPTGHEIGMIEDPKNMDASSLELMEAELKALYFVPTILQILSVERKGSGRTWHVLTDVGERTFRILDRNALDGRKAPGMLITDDNMKRYRIEDYWDMDRDSRRLIQDLLPRKVLRMRAAKKFW